MKIAAFLIVLLVPAGTSQAQDIVPKVQPRDREPGARYLTVPPGQEPWLNRQDYSYVTYSDWDRMPIMQPKHVSPMPNAMKVPVPAQPRYPMSPMPNPMRPQRQRSPAQK